MSSLFSHFSNQNFPSESSPCAPDWNLPLPTIFVSLCRAHESLDRWGRAYISDRPLELSPANVASTGWPWWIKTRFHWLPVGPFDLPNVHPHKQSLADRVNKTWSQTTTFTLYCFWYRVIGVLLLRIRTIWTMIPPRIRGRRRWLPWTWMTDGVMMYYSTSKSESILLLRLPVNEKEMHFFRQFRWSLSFRRWVYRVTIQVVSNLLLTSKQKFRFSMRPVY